MDLQAIREFRTKLRQLEREIAWQLKSDTECCGVTFAQCHIILEIGKAGRASIVDLAAVLGLDTSTLSRHINGMVNVGFVDRVLNPEDRRFVSITLTKQGQKVYRSIDDICNNKYTAILDLIPDEKRQQVLEGFSLLVDAIIQAKKTKNIFGCCSGSISGKGVE